MKKKFKVNGRKAIKFGISPSVAYTQCESHFFEWNFSDQFSLKVLVVVMWYFDRQDITSKTI